MARTPEEIIREQLGNLLLQNAAMASEIEKLREQLAQLQQKPVEAP